MTRQLISRGTLFAIALLVATHAGAISNIITYQGTLEDGGLPANGEYDFNFQLTGESGTLVAATSAENVTVTGGVFTVELDFPPLVFQSFDRALRIGVRPGPSTGAFTTLSPDTPVRPVPQAQHADRAETAFNASNATLASTATVANSVANGVIVEADFVTGAVSSRAIANGDIDTIDLADSAVTDAKIASGSLTQTRMAGGFTSGTIGPLTVGANGCVTFDVSFSGDVDTNDIPLIALQSGESLSANLSLTALRVKSANIVELRACNHGASSAGWPSLDVRLVTFR